MLMMMGTTAETNKGMLVTATSRITSKRSDAEGTPGPAPSPDTVLRHGEEQRLAFPTQSSADRQASGAEER